MWAGVGKSGSPAPKPMTSWPAATRDLALASTARVADSSMAAIRLDRRAKVLAVVSGTPAMLTCPGRERKELTRAALASSALSSSRDHRPHMTADRGAADQAEAL